MEARATVEMSKEELAEFILSKFPEFKGYKLADIYSDKKGLEVHLKKLVDQDIDTDDDIEDDTGDDIDDNNGEDLEGSEETDRSGISKLTEENILESLEKGEKTITEIAKDITGRSGETGSLEYSKTHTILMKLERNNMISSFRENRKSNNTNCKFNIYHIRDDNKEKETVKREIFETLKNGKKSESDLERHLDEFYRVYTLHVGLTELLNELLKSGEIIKKGKDAYDEDLFHTPLHIKEKTKKKNGVPVLVKELAEVNSEEATDLLGKHGKLIIEDPRFQKEKEAIEQRQVEHENKVYNRDQENLRNKQRFLDQLISMGYEIVSHKIEFDGWFDGTHCIEAFVTKNGELKEVKLSTGDKDPEWFLKHKSGGASPLRLNDKELGT